MASGKLVVSFHAITDAQQLISTKIYISLTCILNLNSIMLVSNIFV